MIHYTVDDGLAIIAWEMTSTPMNVLNDESIPQFEAALERAFADDSVVGLIITSNKPEFVAGADLKMILRNNDKDPTVMQGLSTELNRIFRRIETSGKPAVAAINGTALGGGYEICLACHHRIALNTPKAVLGLVEVTLGLLPGAGGTQRLPRMIGMQAALQLMLNGRKVGVQEALQLGMIDAIAESPADMMAQARTWIMSHPKAVCPWDEIDRKTGRIVGRSHFSVPGGNVQSAVGAQTFGLGTAKLMTKTRGNYPAPLAVMSCVYEGLQVDIDRALAIEARHFALVTTSSVAKSLIQTMFLGLNEANKGASRPNDQPKTDVKKVGLLRSGAESVGIASAQAGIDVILYDHLTEAAQSIKSAIQEQIQNAVERGKLDVSTATDLLNRIQPTTSIDDLRDCSLLITSGADSAAINQLLRDVEPVLTHNGAGKQPVVGLYNPAKSVSATAMVAAIPENVIGIHFPGQADRTPIVEVIVGTQTSDYALAVAIDYVRTLRKTPIVVHDAPGFYVSRCQQAYVAEGLALLSEGINPVLIENAGKDAGMPIGPLALAGETKLFSLSPEQPSLSDVKNRLLYRQAIEALRCRDEGVVRTKLDADLGSILGWGFPAYTGGALSFVDFVGVDTFVATLDPLSDTYGERFRLSESLRQHIQ